MRIDFHDIQAFEKTTLPTQSVPHALPTRIDPRVSAACLAVLTNIALIPLPAFANCTTTGTATNCDTSAPSPWTTTIGTGPNALSSSSVMVGPNAQVVVGDASAIALSDNANITVQSGALVQNSAKTAGGTYATGANTIDFRNNSTLTVQQGATVLSAGTQTDRKSTRLNSSHITNSYAVFCLKTKKTSSPPSLLCRPMPRSGATSASH